MALLTVALVFCVYSVTESRENGEFRVAAPSLIRLCEEVKHKPFFCLICKGFNFSCFSSEGTTQSTLPTTPTFPTTTSTTTTTTTTTAAPEA